MIDSFNGARVTVMGLGRFGGGIGVTRWLAGLGARVLVTDQAPPNRLEDSIAAIRDLLDTGAVTLRLGEHREIDFVETDVVIANPAVPRPWENRFLRAAGNAGVPITTEIRLAAERLDRSKVIGVTGSAGKSTTSAMIHHILCALGHRAHLGGNIGGSLLSHLPSPSGRGVGGEGALEGRSPIESGDFVVLELSSAQLHWLGVGAGYPTAGGWSPHVAVLTNIAPNHLDWHGSFEHYRESKLNLARHQSPDDRLIDGGAEHSHILKSVRMSLRVPGKHNVANAGLACLAVNAMTGESIEACAAALADFDGLPHRLQLVAKFDGMRFYNDSKSTTPDATLLAVDSFDDPARIHLIAGGSDKGSDLSPIAMLAPCLAGLYTIGVTGRTIMAHNSPPSQGGGQGVGRALKRSVALHPHPGPPPQRGGGGDARFAQYCETLDRAIDCALGRMKPGDILLLSPGCASFDQFINFEARGQAFVRLVRERCASAGASAGAPMRA